MSVIYKADDDLYVLWSTICDAPEAWGTRAQMTEYLTRRKIELIIEETAERFDRADETGTSMIDGRAPDALIVDQGGTVPFDRLAEFLRSWDETAERFTFPLEPFDDDESTDMPSGQAFGLSQYEP